MSEWKVGDKAYVPVTVEAMRGSVPTVGIYCIGGLSLREPIELLRSIPPPPPAPVDVSAIRVGDEVTVCGVVEEMDTSGVPFSVEFRNDYAWLEGCEFISHTPQPRPTTFAEFNAMAAEQQERWFAEMMKGKVG